MKRPTRHAVDAAHLTDEERAGQIAHLLAVARIRALSKREEAAREPETKAT